MQNNDCQHEFWFAGVMDVFTDFCSCKCLDCGFKKVISIQEIRRENVVTVNKNLNDFKPVTFERAQQVYKEYKKENIVTAKSRVRRKFDN